MMNKDQFTELLAPKLKLAGFRKKGRTWHRENAEVIEVFNIQGSSWDKEDFYINLGIHLKSLDPDSKPSINHCHIQRRVPREMDHQETSTINFAINWFSARDSRSKIKDNLMSDSNEGLVLATIKAELLGSPHVFHPPTA